MARDSSISDFGKIEYTHFSEVLVGETIIEGGGSSSWVPGENLNNKNPLLKQ